jgi:Uma2 family endonuclease
MTVATVPPLKTISSIEHIFPSGDLYSDEPEMESFPHLMQMLLLISCLRWQWQDRHNYFVGGNLTIYFSPRQKKSELFRGPDFFVVLDCDPNPERKSWVVWQEGGKYPNLIIEILSDSTADVDRGEKKQIYQDIFRTPDYFLFDPYEISLEGYHLVEGEYESITANPEGKMWSKQLQLFLGIYENKLRFFAADGQLMQTVEEVADAEIERVNLQIKQTIEATERADLEARRATEATERADLEAKRATEATERANLEASRATEATERANLEASRATEATERANLEASRTTEVTERANLEAKRATEANERADVEYQKRLEIVSRFRRSLSDEQLEALGIDPKDL